MLNLASRTYCFCFLFFFYLVLCNSVIISKSRRIVRTTDENLALDVFLNDIKQAVEIGNVLIDSITGQFLPEPMPEISRLDSEHLHLASISSPEPTLEPVVPLVLPANVSVFPFSAFGKLISTDVNGQRYSCTGAYVGHAYVVMTAAHCVYDQGSWRKDVVFAQQFSDGRGIIRRVKKVWIKQTWTSGPAFRRSYDYAFLTMRDMTAGGYLGLCFPDSYNAGVSVGYPSNFGDGKFLEFVNGQLGSSQNSAVVLQMLGNPFLEGCSGGAWISVDRCAFGLNSFVYKESDGGQKNVVYSPRFTLETRRLWKSAVSAVSLKN